MDFPTIINSINSFPFEGLLECICHFPQSLIEHSLSKNGNPDQTLCSVAFYLGMHCVHMSHKWVTLVISNKTLCKLGVGTIYVFKM